jgi:hypothetical protein
VGGGEVILLELAPSNWVYRGILMRVNEDYFDLEAWSIRRYSVSCEVRYKKDKSRIRIVTIDGTSYEEFK